MKRKFLAIAKQMGVNIISYKTYREPDSGGLQVFHVRIAKDGKEYQFDDSYYHLSGDAPKVLDMFRIEAERFVNKHLNQ